MKVTKIYEQQIIHRTRLHKMRKIFTCNYLISGHTFNGLSITVKLCVNDYIGGESLCKLLLVNYYQFTNRH